MTAQAFTFSPPKSFSYTIPGNLFLSDLFPSNNNVTLSRKPGGYVTKFPGTGYAPVQLPQGATVTGMDVLYYDNDNPDTASGSWLSFTTHLKRVPIITANATDQDVIAFPLTNPVNHTNTSIIISPSGPPVAGREVVDNTANTYYVTVQMNPDANPALGELDLLRFYGIRVRYTLGTLAP
jgi:hypothetical protein